MTSVPYLPVDVVVNLAVVCRVVEQGSNLWIVMEYVGGGSALDLLKPGPMEEEYIAIIIRDILKGLEYLHAERKLHRDIKGSSYVLNLLTASVRSSFSLSSDGSCRVFCVRLLVAA